MSKPRNDEIEYYYFNKFQQAYRLPDGPVAYGDRPDVIIRGTRKIGIEITNLFLKSGNSLDSEQRQRPLRDPIIQEARKLYCAGGGSSNTGLTVCFDENNPVELAKRRELQRRLADFIRSVDNDESGNIRPCLFRERMPEIWSLWLHSKEQSDAKWRLLGRRSPTLMSKNNLETKLREKEAKASDYEKCDAHWLLIVVDGIDAAQDQEIRVDDPHLESEVFDKIIIYEPLFGHIVEVK